MYNLSPYPVSNTSANELHLNVILLLKKKSKEMSLSKTLKPVFAECFVCYTRMWTLLMLNGL